MGRNFVPRQNRDGSLGTSQKRWRSVYAEKLILGSNDLSGNIFLEADVGSENNPSIVFDITNHKWLISADGINYSEIEVKYHKHDDIYLNKNNVLPYTPTEDYHPATKKYVDTQIQSITIDPTMMETFIYEQTTPSDTWTINHNLNKFPSVTIVDSQGYVIAGDVRYVDSNTIILTFTESVVGKAYLN